MKEHLVTVRNFLAKLKYKYIWKPVFFAFDPENIHDGMTVFLQFFEKYALTRKLTYFCFYSIR